MESVTSISSFFSDAILYLGSSIHPSEVPYDALVAIFLGFASAVVDNVPLVAAAQGMSLR